MYKVIKKKASYTVFLFCCLLVCGGCATLPKDRIDALTTCNVSLEEVRRKLLKLGYGLKADEPDFINTDFQVPAFEKSSTLAVLGALSGSRARIAYAFMIEKTSDQSIRIVKTKFKILSTSSYGGDSQTEPSDLKFRSNTEKRHKRIKNLICY